ncbi:hypothetical protein SAMN02745174_02309 [Cetobacterium ceti]|uniref:Uncharacterized protein n=1 Tax=Cetobacterium ceti TaxID=180163 RepID=A0A1T4QFD1_9FUSO|nr:hypothetical protein [Cetobacterium ceti]SKA02510.1 hypothetical protein SAMN02745174_02309 [Cetobacterium ceti]
MKYFKLFSFSIFLLLLSGCFSNDKAIELVKQTKAPNIISFFSGTTPTIGELATLIKGSTYKTFTKNDNLYVELSWIDNDKNSVKVNYYVNLNTSKVAFSSMFINDKEKSEIYYQGILTQLVNEYNNQKN